MSLHGSYFVCVMCRFCEDACHEVLGFHPCGSGEDPNVLKKKKGSMFKFLIVHVLNDHVDQCSCYSCSFPSMFMFLMILESLFCCLYVK